MNERIKELARQAGFQYIKDEGIGWAGNHSSSLPKFAELIIKECAKELDDRTVYVRGVRAGTWIKNYMGLEE